MQSGARDRLRVAIYTRLRRVSTAARPACAARGSGDGTETARARCDIFQRSKHRLHQAAELGDRLVSASRTAPPDISPRGETAHAGAVGVAAIVR
jgi:hypothetical protein